MKVMLCYKLPSAFQCYLALCKNSWVSVLHKNQYSVLKWCHRPFLTMARTDKYIDGRNTWRMKQNLTFVCKSYMSRLVYSKKKVGIVVPVFLEAEKHVNRVAVIDQNGKFSYEDLLHYSSNLALVIQQMMSPKALKKSSCVAFLCENDLSYVVAQWAIWMNEGIAVPLCKTHPVSELEYFIADSQAPLVITTEAFVDKIEPVSRKLNVPLFVLKKESYTGEYKSETQSDPSLSLKLKVYYANMLRDNKYKNLPAMIVYTSGTTGRPKGVLMTHGNLFAQINMMVEAWGWSKSDVVLHVLPLHHVHGIVNVLMTSLYCGATCVMLPKFDSKSTWSALLNQGQMVHSVQITLFMAVPTIYAKLIEYLESEVLNVNGFNLIAKFVRSSCQSKIRLMVSGSAALPQPIMEKWMIHTGHTLLERYGMTETGMILTNPLHGERIPGAVGNPFPGVEVCIGKPNVYSATGYDIITRGDSKHSKTTPGMEKESGELLVKGPNVFKEYWKKAEATKAAFTSDGWFKTGDTAIYCHEKKVYKIIGRTSVDIIKSGAYKISALDIERHLLAHPDIRDCAVVGLPDLTWGQQVAAVIVTRPEVTLTLQDIKEWAGDKMPPYHIPRIVKFLPTIPRNAMGKVNKKDLVTQVFG
ncbi:hypothetical protein ACJMK2_010189 [Sinanodonta woodiana]|uniref:Acyl-CoA synthetase family member 3, mitochondrial n=1 Tax=Sinanodonta woodiana TaxID=1069815 RepID=A0ABD3VEJ4_SINWO